MIPLRDNVVHKQPPLVVLALIAVNIAVFLYQIVLPDDAAVEFIYRHGLVPYRYSDSMWGLLNGLPSDDYWPFVTSAFVHGGWLHLIFNMWTLYLFGSTLEGRLGPVQFLVFYLCCAALSMSTHAYFNADSAVPVIGASGAVAGVIGAYAASFPSARITLLVPIVFIPLIFSIPAIAFAVFWFALQVFQGASDALLPRIGGNVAWWAHIGGFVAGLILLPVFLLLAPSRPMRIRWDRDPWENAKDDA